MNVFFQFRLYYDSWVKVLSAKRKRSPVLSDIVKCLPLCFVAAWLACVAGARKGEGNRACRARLAEKVFPFPSLSARVARAQIPFSLPLSIACHAGYSLVKETLGRCCFHNFLARRYPTDIVSSISILPSYTNYDMKIIASDMNELN